MVEEISKYKGDTTWWRRGDFYYVAARKSTGTTTMKCAHPRCPTKWTLKNETLSPLSEPHDHEPTPWIEDRNVLFQLLKRRAREDTIPLHAIYEEEAARHPAGASHLLFESVVSSLKRWRMEARPTIPATFEAYANALHGMARYNPRLIGTIITPAGNALILGMEGFAEILRAAEQIIVDGTFKTVPAQFPATQLLTIHVVHQGHYYHPVMALMNNKSYNLYVQVMEQIVRVAGLLRPSDFITDYEPALQGALRDTFGVPVHGCYFHYMQALHRKARSLGVGTRRNNAGWAMVHLYGALAILPAAQVAAGLIEVHQVCLERAIPRAAEFYAYFQLQWMQRVGPDVFSVHNRIHRTSNVAESFHASLGRSLQPHPNIWRFTDVLIQKMTVCHARYTAAIEGSSRRRNVVQNPRWRHINEQLADLDRGVLTLREFLLSISTREQLRLNIDAVPFVGQEIEIDEGVASPAVAASPAAAAPMCAICTDNVPNLVLVPCGHVVCNACWGQLTSCPFCRAEVTAAQRFYLS